MQLVALVYGILFLNILSVSAAGSNVYRLAPIKIIEEPPIGTLIIDLASKLDINDLATSDYKFRFYSPHSLSAHYFLIDQLTGHVKTQRSIDREYLCETNACGPCTSDGNCTLPIQIVVGTSTTSQGLLDRMVQQKFVSLDVLIEDKNEFEPKFSLDELTIEINENTPVNFTIPIESAVDRDSRQSEITYSLVSIDDSRDFVLASSSDSETLSSRIRLETSANGPSHTQQLNLVILKPFDYEKEKEFSFKILASDGTSSTSQIGSQLITLKIIDLNDNLPIFDRHEYEYRLDEDKAVAGTRLIRVHASDKDDGLNGQVKYYFVDGALKSDRAEQQSQQSIQIKNLFQIDENSGWISVNDNTNLDYEQIPMYQLTIRAQDQGLSNSMPVYTNVIIYLNDVNDNSPKITLTLPSTIDDFTSSSYETKSTSLIKNMDLSEWTMPETFLAQVTISDQDSGLNGKLNISLSQLKRKTDVMPEVWTQSEDFSLVHLFSNIYSLMTKQRLDRESFDAYALDIVVSDSGQPKSLLSTYELTIRIKDENDNHPLFVNADGQEIKSYEFNLDEFKSDDDEHDKWIEIGQVHAVDSDIDHNSKITYELIPLIETQLSVVNKTVAFEIDSNTGWVKADKSVLDHEIATRFEFKVVARDNSHNLANSASVSNKVEAKLVVNLFDLNDNAPVFDQDVYRFEIVENLDAIKFGQVKATDADESDTLNSLVKYRFVDDLESRKYFDVDENTGELYLLKPLDYEYASVYELQLQAYDKNDAKDSLSSTCTIRVDVLDTNDNAPHLISPTDEEMPKVISLETLNRAENSVSLLQLNVSDADSGIFSRLRFKLERQIKLEQVNYTNGVIIDKIPVKSEVNLFDCNMDSGLISGEFTHINDETLAGLYALVIRITDGSVDTFQFNTRAYVFIALTKGDQYSREINYLRRLVYNAGLNKPIFSKHGSKLFNRQNSKFNRLITMYQLKNSPGLNSGSSFAKLGTELMRTINGENFKYFLVVSGIACLIICALIFMLCMSIYWCRQRKCASSLKSSKLMNLTGSSNSNSDVQNSGNGSTSPSSLTSSELVDNYSSEENLKYNKYTLPKNKTINIYDNYDSSRLIKSPCHQHTSTIIRANRVNVKNGTIGEEQEVLIVPNKSDSNQKRVDCSDQLLVQVSSLDTKKMVASTESLTSYNSNNSTAKTSTTSQNSSSITQKTTTVEASPNSFKTFKSAAAYSPSSSKQDNSNSYRTLPINGYRNLSEMHLQQSTPSKRHGFDQKPLNLPVNELFKRYEMKKNGNDSQGNSVTSSSVHSSLSSLQHSSQAVQSPQKQFNLQLINENTNQVPDYFFKDEKEYKKLLAQTNRQPKMNLKQVIHNTLSPKGKE